MRVRVVGFVQTIAASLTLAAMQAAQASDMPDQSDLETGIELSSELQGELESEGAVTNYELEASWNVDATLALADRLRLVSEMKFIARTLREENYEEHTLGVEFDDFYLLYQKDSWGLIAGRFTPTFGLVNEQLAGLFSDYFTSDYELEDRLGLAASLNLRGADLGQMEVQLATFMADRTILSGSLTNHATFLSHSDGGPSNTRGLESYSIAITGSQIPSLPGTSYFFGLQSQAPGVDSDLRTRGATAGFNVDLKLESSVFQNAQALVEFAHIQNLESEMMDRNYGTLGLTFQSDSWTSTLAATLVGTSGADAEYRGMDWFVQLALEYDFDDDASLELSLAQKSESGRGGLLAGFKWTKYFSEFQGDFFGQ